MQKRFARVVGPRGPAWGGGARKKKTFGRLRRVESLREERESSVLQHKPFDDSGPRGKVGPSAGKATEGSFCSIIGGSTCCVCREFYRHNGTRACTDSADFSRPSTRRSRRLPPRSPHNGLAHNLRLGTPCLPARFTGGLAHAGRAVFTAAGSRTIQMAPRTTTRTPQAALAKKNPDRHADQSQTESDQRGQKKLHRKNLPLVPLSERAVSPRESARVPMPYCWQVRRKIQGFPWKQGPARADGLACNRDS